MKKHLLIAAALVLSASGFAQGNRKAAINRPIKATSENKIDKDAFPVAGTKAITGPTTLPTSAICNPPKFTSVVNVFAVGGGVTTYQQNCLSYNKDLNTVTWTSRRSADWAFTGATSGAIQSTWVDVTTGIWDSTILYKDSQNGHGARYPGGVMFNPSGNTSVANAFLVGSGSVTGGTGWLGAWYASRKADANHLNTAIPDTIDFQAVGTAPFGNAGNSFTNCGFVNLDMQQVGNSVMVGSALFDYTANTETKGAVIGKGIYSTTGDSLAWSADSIEPGFLSTPLGLMSDGLGGRLAFSPDGMTGYLVFNGRLSTNYNTNADSSMMPIVYKTTNGGANWNLVLAGYDWELEHPEIRQGVGYLLGVKASHPTPNYQHGTDLTVDAKGVLHYVTTITMPWQDGRYAGGGHDSLQYTYQYKWDHVYNHPIIWDLMTDGTCWKTLLVDSIITSYVGSDPSSDSTAAYSSWDNTGAFMPYGAHLTVSRSSDGNAIFYGWGDSDTSVTGHHHNSQPEMMMKAFDINTSMMSPLVNVTSGIGSCFFSYLSDNSYFDAGQGGWVVPFVYVIGRQTVAPGVYNGLTACDYYYGDCQMFNASNINVPVTINGEMVSTGCTISVKSNNNYLTSVANYPNPFNHSTKIVVTLNEGKAIDLKVYDALGKLVHTKKTNGNVGENTIVFDGSSLQAGVYYYTITAGYEKVTNKMVIQK